MDLNNIYKELSSIKNDKDKVIYFAKIISYLENLKQSIAFAPSETNFINIINEELKKEIDNIINKLIEDFSNEITFLLYYNNEEKNNNRFSRNSGIR